MNTSVTPEQIDHYQRDGFVVVDDFLSSGELSDLIAAVTDAVEAIGSKRLAVEGNDDYEDVDSYYSKVFLQRINLWKINKTIADCFRKPELGRMLCRLARVDGFRIWHDHTLQKLPWANPTSWHIDGPNWSFHSRDVLSVWIALDAATIQNGCMYFLPGTHKTAEFERNAGFGPQVGALFDVYPEWREIEAVPIELKAGSASIHNGLLAHSAGPNMTPHSRRAMACIYMPDGSTFNGVQNILSKEQAARWKIGDVLDDEEIVPLVWRNKGED